MKVITKFINPPVPFRCCDWSAVLSGYEPGDVMGFGETEQQAIDDLMKQIGEYGEANG